MSKTYKDTNGVECVLVEHLQRFRLPDGSFEMRPTGELIGKPIHHDTDELEHIDGQPFKGGDQIGLELRPIDKSKYGKPA